MSKQKKEPKPKGERVWINEYRKNGTPGWLILNRAWNTKADALRWINARGMQEGFTYRVRKYIPS